MLDHDFIPAPNAEFAAAQEGMAALFTLREKSKKGIFGPYIGVFRVVIS